MANHGCKNSQTCKGAWGNNYNWIQGNAVQTWEIIYLGIASIKLSGWSIQLCQVDRYNYGHLLAVLPGGSIQLWQLDPRLRRSRNPLMPLFRLRQRRPTPAPTPSPALCRLRLPPPELRCSESIAFEYGQGKLNDAYRRRSRGSNNISPCCPQSSSRSRNLFWFVFKSVGWLSNQMSASAVAWTS